MMNSLLSSSLIGVGIAQVILGFAHAFFKKYFNWDQELKPVNLLTRQIFYVHTFFIAFVVVLFGVLTIVCYQELLVPSKMALIITALLFLFWTVRLIFQFLVYSSKLWQGDPFRTVMHILFSLLWIWLTATYGFLFYLQLTS